MHPYRCVGCGHRFLEVDQAWAEDAKLLLTGAALLVFFLGGMGALFYLGTDKLRDAEELPEQADRVIGHLPRVGEDDHLDTFYELALGPAEATSGDQATISEARDRVLEAAEQGDTKAMIYLGLMYRRGVGVLQNYTLAAHWIQKAADSGDHQGMLELGRLYRDGVGFDKDLVRAYYWFNRSAAAYNMEAVRERDLVSQLLVPEELKAAQDLAVQY